MMKVLLITLFAIAIGSIAAQAQGSGTWAGVSQCWDASSHQWVTVHREIVRHQAAEAGAEAVTSPTVMGCTSAYLFSLSTLSSTGFSAAGQTRTRRMRRLRQQQEQLMMAEVRRRAEEAERLHQEEEARRLAAIYNRLAVHAEAERTAPSGAEDLGHSGGRPATEARRQRDRRECGEQSACPRL